MDLPTKLKCTTFYGVERDYVVQFVDRGTRDSEAYGRPGRSGSAIEGHAEGTNRP